MWIRMRTTAAGPNLNPPLQAGHEYNVDDAIARPLIAARAAEEIPAPKKATPHHHAVKETKAVDERGEKAVEPDAKPLIDQLTGDSSKAAAAEAKSAEEDDEEEADGDEESEEAKPKAGKKAKSGGR